MLILMITMKAKLKWDKCLMITATDLYVTNNQKFISPVKLLTKEKIMKEHIDYDQREDLKLFP